MPMVQEIFGCLLRVIPASNFLKECHFRMANCLDAARDLQCAIRETSHWGKFLA